MHKFHKQSAPISQLINELLEKPSKKNIKQAEALQEFYDFTLAQAVRLETIEKEAIFLRAMLDESYNQYHDMAMIAEEKVMRKVARTIKLPETIEALKDLAFANGVLFKK